MHILKIIGIVIGSIVAVGLIGWIILVKLVLSRLPR